MVSNYKDFREIPVWQLAQRLTVRVYVLTRSFPKEENFGLTSQIRRSSSSVPANIAEGVHKYTTNDLVHFLHIARGSAGETMSHLVLAKDLNYIDETTYNELFEEYENVIKQLNAWIKSLKERIK